MIFSLLHVAPLPVMTPLLPSGKTKKCSPRLSQLVVRLHCFPHVFVGLRRRFPLSFISDFRPLGAPKTTAEQMQSEKDTAANREKPSQHQGHLIPHGCVRMGMGGVCARQDNTPEWRHVIEISIKEVIPGVIAEVLWFCVCVCERANVEKRQLYCGICHF